MKDYQTSNHIGKDQINTSKNKDKKENKNLAANSTLVCLSDIEAEKVEFLWKPYIPIGKITLIEGDPGVGKSWITTALISILSRGDNFPDNENSTIANSLIYSAEDGLGDTIKPRIIKLDGDDTKIFAHPDPLELDETGLKIIEAEIKEKHPSLVVIDPLTAYIGRKVDMYRSNEVRPMMARLAKIAMCSNCAIVIVRHLNKSDKTKTIYRGAGSIDFTAAARSVLLVGVDPSDKTNRALIHIKSNLEEQGDAIGFSIENGCLKWTGKSDLTQSDILSSDISEKKVSALDQAKSFLHEILSNGKMLQKDIFCEGKKQGISEKTLFRSKKILKIKSNREGFAGKQGGGEWYWELPKCLDSQEKDDSGLVNLTDEKEQRQINWLDDAKGLGSQTSHKDNLAILTSDEISNHNEQGLKRS